jgi:hypothetical protein
VRESSENAKRNNGSKFFSKIQNLLLLSKQADSKATSRDSKATSRDSKATPRDSKATLRDSKATPRESSQKASSSSSKDQGLKVLKGNLMKTISLHMKQTSSVEKKLASESNKKIVINKGKKENTSVEGKIAYQSEGKLLKPSAAVIPKANALLKKSIEDNKAEGQARKMFLKIGKIESPKARNGSANKNPEYFEIQKISSTNTVVKSPAYRNKLSSNNIAKMINGFKAANDFRSSASLLKNKELFRPVVVRQSSSNK